MKTSKTPEAAYLPKQLTGTVALANRKATSQQNGMYLRVHAGDACKNRQVQTLLSSVLPSSHLLVGLTAAAGAVKYMSWVTEILLTGAGRRRRVEGGGG